MAALREKLADYGLDDDDDETGTGADEAEDVGHGGDGTGTGDQDGGQPGEGIGAYPGARVVRGRGWPGFVLRLVSTATAEEEAEAEVAERRRQAEAAAEGEAGGAAEGEARGGPDTLHGLRLDLRYERQRSTTIIYL